MTIIAAIRNNSQENNIIVSTNGNQKGISIPSKPGGGSSVNGGEMLFLALAICFSNDIYREAANRKMEIDGVDCTVSGEFGKEGEPGSNIAYAVKIIAPHHSESEIGDLIAYVDTIAEVHNTIRKGATVSLKL
jgi:organic hydroperoxide reductase OsmC/OhrA